eukprot:TRINITY_DN3010_c1_g1_i1.p1 TRINITY_DN3010_c1_g1~~TRINITY_DN3010_c1_g1_i1.p1  ORF type:complete len:255 (-),score=31.85 TRINITY_DN3010_c1_g1_i1:55-819(-)
MTSITNPPDHNNSMSNLPREIITLILLKNNYSKYPITPHIYLVCRPLLENKNSHSFQRDIYLRDFGIGKSDGDYIGCYFKLSSLFFSLNVHERVIFAAENHCHILLQRHLEGLERDQYSFVIVEKLAAKACKSGHDLVLDVLIEYCPDLVHYRNKIGRMLIHQAVFFGNINCVRVLCERDADLSQVESTYMQTVFHIASRRGWTDILLYLFDQVDNFDIDTVDIDGWTCLHVGVLSDAEDIVRILMEKGGYFSS